MEITNSRSLFNPQIHYKCYTSIAGMFSCNMVITLTSYICNSLIETMPSVTDNPMSSNRKLYIANTDQHMAVLKHPLGQSKSDSLFHLPSHKHSYTEQLTVVSVYIFNIVLVPHGNRTYNPGVASAMLYQQSTLGPPAPCE